MKIKTSEAKDQVLDCLVAKCEGRGIEFEDPRDPWLTLDGIAHQPLHSYTPSTDWAQGGPIIERKRIGIVPSEDDANVWVGSMFEPDWKFNRTGPTPLIAAMRCYVASKLGDEVEVPDGLN